uniref:Sialin n=2 Tax=Lygus hesperus TaxID=30085 RepID=A0A146KJP9_LYGHE
MASPEKTFLDKFKIFPLTCVKVLNIMVFFGFMANYMLRVNLTLAIVAMVTDGNSTAINSTAINATGTDDLSYAPADDRFEWDSYKKNLIHGCFYWGYILTELPGGRMSEVFGPKIVFGVSIGVASFVTLLIPVAAHVLDFYGVIIIRVIVGFMLGVTFPAMQPIASKWIPPKDRTKFVSNMMASSLGAAVTLPICGQLIAAFNWESVFYVTGILGLLWTLAWYFLVFDSPGQHPRITKKEKDYLEASIGASSKQKKAYAVPWKQVLTSPPVWAIVVTHGASVFCFFTFLNQMPTYMNAVLKLDIKKNGLLNSFPYIGKYVMALITAFIADYIRGTGKLSTTATRKIFTTFAVGLPGLLMVAQVYLGDSTFWTVTIFTIALTLNGAVTAGYLGNGLDIAPNFSGTIFGMANTLSSIGGFISSGIVAQITYQNETYDRFRIIFWILAATYIVGSCFYLVFGSGVLQEWNTPKEVAANGHSKKDVELQEKEPLKDTAA